MPDALADEIIAERGRWSLCDALFRPVATTGALPVSVAVNGEYIWSDVALDGQSLRDARRNAAAFRRAGYKILCVRDEPFHARRRLWGLRELDAEVRHLHALSRDPTALHSLPSRIPRSRGLPPAGAEPLSLAAFEHLRHAHGWTLDCVMAGRKGAVTVPRALGWQTGAWCYAVDDGDERRVELNVSLFKKERWTPADDTVFPRVTRVYREQLEPLGYARIKRRGLNGPRFAVFDKDLRTISEARRERARLDRVLFGDHNA